MKVEKFKCKQEDAVKVANEFWLALGQDPKTITISKEEREKIIVGTKNLHLKVQSHINLCSDATSWYEGKTKIIVK